MAALVSNDSQSLLPIALSPPRMRGEEDSKQSGGKETEDRFTWPLPCSAVEVCLRKLCMIFTMCWLKHYQNPNASEMSNWERFINLHEKLKSISVHYSSLIWFMWHKRHDRGHYHTTVQLLCGSLIRTHYHSITNLMLKELIYTERKLRTMTVEDSMCLTVFHWGAPGH